MFNLILSELMLCIHPCYVNSVPEMMLSGDEKERDRSRS